MICKCCGAVMREEISQANPNVCAGCDSIEWDLPQEIHMEREALPGFEYTASGSEMMGHGALSSEVPSEFARFVEVEDPSVLECLDAESAAKQAIAEVAGAEGKAETGIEQVSTAPAK